MDVVLPTSTAVGHVVCAKDNELRTTKGRPRSADVRPNSILGNFESVDKIVVYAFGAFDRYYICWQDKCGTYKQERHGLPQLLDQWLFPEDGSTRDLATLQVSLGHHDEFFAFDKMERISHKNLELRESAGNVSHTSQSSDAHLFNAATEVRRKSHTFSHPASTDDAQTLSMKRTAQPRMLRPRSIAITGALSLKSWHDRRKSQERPLQIPESTEGLHAGRPHLGQPSATRHHTYLDAGVQTDLREEEDTSCTVSFGSLTDDHSLPGLRRPQRSHISSISSINSLLSDDSSMTMHSVSSVSSTSSLYGRNPVYMGAMQNYFRESQYRLGDALMKAPQMSVDAH